MGLAKYWAQTGLRLLVRRRRHHRGAHIIRISQETLGPTNFVLTVAGVGAVVLLLRTDVRQSAAILRRNVKHIRNWLEEETAASSKAMEKSSPKELESKVSPRDTPKEDKH